jgi:hypothetical protein
VAVEAKQRKNDELERLTLILCHILSVCVVTPCGVGIFIDGASADTLIDSNFI